MSLGNYIGINEEPGQIFGKTMSTPTSSSWLIAQRPVSHEEKVAIETGPVRLLHPMVAKKRLAREFVAEYHGDSGVDGPGRFERVFSHGQLPDDIPELRCPRQSSWMAESGSSADDAGAMAPAAVRRTALSGRGTHRRRPRESSGDHVAAAMA